jgi:predicted phage terminase large subunit-like protein
MISRRKPEVPPFDEWLPVVTPTFNWQWRHLVFTAEYLEKIASGEIKKLMIFEPPRHGKSEMTTVRFPVWMLERDPSKRIIVGAYNQFFASKFGRKARRIATERIPLATDRNAVDDWETVAGGGFRSVGVGAGVTGQGGDLIVIDDPVKSREEANSAAYREKVWSWYTDDLYTRLEPGGAIVLIMTRWHQDDLAGRILGSEDAKNWTVINLPAFAEANDPLGRVEGEALCPERYDCEDLKKIQVVMGSSFQALFQQRPSALEGSIFKREWWRFYKEAPKFRRIIQSWDTGFKKGQGNDPSCCTTWGEAEAGYYLLECWKERVEFPELKRTSKSQFDKWHPSAVLIEDKASGQSLIQELKRETRIPVLAINVDVDKEARANSITPTIEAGKVFLPDSAQWLQDFIDELATFPNGMHDDQVDSLTQALAYLSRGAGTTGFLDYMAQLAAEKQTAQEEKKAA